jgi:hypothetical protein
MALTYAIKKRIARGNCRERLVEITLDTDYPADGWTLDPQDCGLLSTIDMLVVVGFEQNPIGYVFAFDHPDQLLKVYEAGADGGDLDEVQVGENNLANVVVRVLVTEVFNG